METLKEILDLATQKVSTMGRFEWDGIKNYLIEYDLKREMNIIWNSECQEYDSDWDKECPNHELCMYKTKIDNLFKIAVYFEDLNFIKLYKKFL